MDAGGIGPRGLALNETTGELLVANYFSDTISVLDAATGAVRAVIPLGPPVAMTDRRRGHMLFNDARSASRSGSRARAATRKTPP